MLFLWPNTQPVRASIKECTQCFTNGQKVLSLLLSHFPFYSNLLPADIFCLREYLSGKNGRVVKPFV